MANIINHNNSLAVLYPELAKQWDLEANGSLTPFDVTAGSHREVNWMGPCGHRWPAAVKDRVRGYGCPICAGKRVVPGINDLASNYPQLAKEWDYEKNSTLVPENVTSKSGKKAWWLCPEGHSYGARITERVRGSGCPYCGRKIVVKGKTDLLSGYPLLAKEWLFEKNEGLTPDQVFQHSHRKVWWKCSLCGSEWEATIDSRTRENGCPQCAKRMQTSYPEQAIFYYVKQVFPEAVNGYRALFNHVMELDIYIPSIKTGIEYDGKRWHSGEKEQKREEVKYSICREHGIRLLRVRESADRSGLENCDVLIVTNASLDKTIEATLKCLNINVDIDTKRDRWNIYAAYITYMRTNSLAVKYPEYAKEWHPKMNGSLTPEMFTSSTDKVFWWKCSKGHDYQSSIAHRTSGSGCPYCAHRKILSGFNDLATTHRDSKLLREWDYEENELLGLTPSMVMAGSKKSVNWKCEKGHKWRATVQGRTSGIGCPVCSNRTVVAGINDFASAHPVIAKEWHPTKNGALMPTDVAPSSNKKVWWRCKLGHEWEATVEMRHQGTGCPYCSNRKVLGGFNDLLTTNPKLAYEWHPYKNKDLLPSMVTAGSDKRVWWICGNGHEWQAAIKDRSENHGCPVCARQRR